MTNPFPLIFFTDNVYVDRIFFEGVIAFLKAKAVPVVDGDESDSFAIKPNESIPLLLSPNVINR